MQLQFHKIFHKDYESLQKNDKESVSKALVLFEQNPFHPRLRNHALKGTMKDYRAFSAGFNIRIIYKEEGHHALILFLRVGTHAKVYKTSN